MVTAEFAVALPAFVVVVMASIAAVVAVTAQLRCVDAAAVAARMAARGDDTAVVRAIALAAAPRSAELQLAQTPKTVTATVSTRLSVPGLGAFLPGVEVRATSVDAVEPNVDLVQSDAQVASDSAAFAGAGG
jgi:hypothetical protein